MRIIPSIISTMWKNHRGRAEFVIVIIIIMTIVSIFVYSGHLLDERDALREIGTIQYTELNAKVVMNSSPRIENAIRSAMADGKITYGELELFNEAYMVDAKTKLLETIK